MSKGVRRPAHVQLGIVPELTTLGRKDYSRVLVQPLGRAILSAIPPIERAAGTGTTAERLAALLHHDSIGSIQARLNELHREGVLIKHGPFYFRKSLPAATCPEPREGFQACYNWAERFHQAWLAIFAQQGYSNMTRAEQIEDRRLGVDYIDRALNRRVAVRVSSAESLRYTDMRVRCFSEQTGRPAELAKLRQSLCSRYYYGTANEGATALARWIEVDLIQVRAHHLLDHVRPLTGQNFGIIPFDALFQIGAIVDWSWRMKP